MNEITILLIILAIAIWFASILVKRADVNWISLIVAICGLCSTLIDDTLSEPEMMLLILPSVMITMFSGLRIMGFKGE